MDSRALFEKFATAPDSSLHLSKAELCFAHPESKQRDHSHSMSRLKTRAAKESSKISDEDLNFVPPTNAFSFLAHAGGKAMLTPENREFSERTMQALPSTFIPEYSPRAAELSVENGYQKEEFSDYLCDLLSMCQPNLLKDSCEGNLNAKEIVLDASVLMTMNASRKTGIQPDMNMPILLNSNSYTSFLLLIVESIQPRHLGHILEALQDMLPESVQDLMEPLHEIIEEGAEKLANLKNLPDHKAYKQHVSPDLCGDNNGDNSNNLHTVKTVTFAASVQSVVLHKQRTSLCCKKINLVWLFGCVMLFAGAATICLVAALATSSNCGCTCLMNSTFSS